MVYRELTQCSLCLPQDSHEMHTPRCISLYSTLKCTHRRGAQAAGWPRRWVGLANANADIGQASTHPGADCWKKPAAPAAAETADPAAEAAAGEAEATVTAAQAAKAAQVLAEAQVQTHAQVLAQAQAQTQAAGQTGASRSTAGTTTMPLEISAPFSNSSK